MEIIHRLNAGWTLTDGILPPIALNRPMSVYPALLQAGYVPDARLGLNLAAAEWLYSRAFTYSLRFDLPPMQDLERVQLRFEHLYGRCTVTLNGRALEPYQYGSFDITAVVTPTGNRLSVSVAPEPLFRPFEGDPLPARGIAGGVYLKGANRVTVRSARFSAGEALDCALDLDAHISGRFLFTCLVSREGEALCEHSTHLRLIAARQDVQLRFPLPDGAAGAYEVRLTIAHNGLMCDALRGSVYVAPSRARRAVCHIRGDARAETDAAVLAALPALAAAGFDGVSFSDGRLCSRPVETKLFDLGLSCVAHDPAAPCFAGCMSGAALRSLAAPDRPWPPTAAAWRLRHSLVPDFEAVERDFGPTPADDADVCAAVIRLHQAHRVFDQIVSDRRAGRPAALLCDADGFPRFGSCALTEPDGAPRPALSAAREALQPMLAVAALPDPSHPVLPCGELLRLPVTLLSDEPSPLPVTVTATMYAPDGGVLSGVSFTALPNGAQQVGDLVCQLPAGATHALLRTGVERPGEPPITHDMWIRCGESPMALARLPRSTLEVSDGSARCKSHMAVGVVTHTGIRCLLPEESAAGYAGECVNG